MKRRILAFGMITVAGSFSSVSVLADALNSNNQYDIHILKDGDTLSQVLSDRGLKPLYGKDQWIDQILDLNHLTKEQVKNIKTGYPILLPFSKKTIVKVKTDTINTAQASTIHYGLIGNRISDHQDLYIDLGFFQSTSRLLNKKIEQNSNFKFGITYQDRNKREYFGFKIKPEVSFSATGHGPAEFDNDNSISASYQPTYQTQLSLRMDHDKVDFSFGPYIEFLEASHLDEIGNEIKVRRDQFLSLGAIATKTYEKNNIIYILRASIGTSALSNNLNQHSQIQMVASKVSADVNLTKDYYIGGFWNIENYSNTANTNSSAVGINLKYFVK